MTRLTTDEALGKQRAQEKILSTIGTLFDELIEVGLDPDSDFSSREEQTFNWTNEVGRRHLAANLQAMSDGFSDRLRIKRREDEADCTVEELGLNWRAYHLHHRAPRVYFTLCGPLKLERSTYREVGLYNGPTVVPLDLKVGFLEGLSPLLAKSVALGGRFEATSKT